MNFTEREETAFFSIRRKRHENVMGSDPSRDPDMNRPPNAFNCSTTLSMMASHTSTKMAELHLIAASSIGSFGGEHIFRTYYFSPRTLYLAIDPLV